MWAVYFVLFTSAVQIVARQFWGIKRNLTFRTLRLGHAGKAPNLDSVQNPDYSNNGFESNLMSHFP